jgi:hypothetical protein
VRVIRTSVTKFGNNWLEGAEATTVRGLAVEPSDHPVKTSLEPPDVCGVGTAMEQVAPLCHAKTCKPVYVPGWHPTPARVYCAVPADGVIWITAGAGSRRAMYPSMRPLGQPVGRYDTDELLPAT